MAGGDRDWRKYERQIYDALRDLADGDAEIVFDASLPGRFSGVNRQVDVLVTGSFAGLTNARMTVDCKCYGRKVDVKDVETFMGLYGDVRTDFGLIVTTEGYTNAAKNRADAPGIRIDIVPYADLRDWEPPFHFCEVCTNPASDNMPGGVYIEPFVQGHVPPGAELVRGVGSCDRCQAMYMECSCGTINHSLEFQEDEWLECEGGCGAEWKTDAPEQDRKGLFLTGHDYERVSFRN